MVVLSRPQGTSATVAGRRPAQPTSAAVEVRPATLENDLCLRKRRPLQKPVQASALQASVRRPLRRRPLSAGRKELRVSRRLCKFSDDEGVRLVKITSITVARVGLGKRDFWGRRAPEMRSLQACDWCCVPQDVLVEKPLPALDVAAECKGVMGAAA